MNEEKSCRICLGTEEPENLIRPCHCNGGMRYVHRNCLNEWRLQNVADGYYSCDICRYRYTFRRIWWARLLESKLTSGGISIVLFVTSIIVFGYVSAETINRMWYWFNHDTYHSPHRLQVLFYGLTIVGLPGLYMMIRDYILNMNFNDVAEHVVRQRGNSYTPYVYIYPQETVRQRDMEKKEVAKEEKPKVADYKSPSLFLWIPVLIGASKTVYTTYRYINTKCRTYCNTIQELIENVN
jgi:hypothetical protein